MDEIFDQLLGQVGQGQGLDALSARVGAPPDKTADAVKLALPALFGALSRNAQSPAGAESLLGALDRDHDGSVLDDLVGMLGSSGGLGGALGGGGGGRGLDGGAILEHVLGGRRGGVEGEISRGSGLDGSQITQLLMALAPLVMGALGKAQREHRMGSQELGYELGRVSKRAEDSLGERFGPLGGLLDQDGDGRLDPGVVRMGKSLLGRLFRR